MYSHMCWCGWHVCLLRDTEDHLWTLTSKPSPSTFFGWKHSADRQGSHSPALVRAFREPLQWPRHCAGNSLVKIPQVDVKLELDDPRTREEIRKATMQLKVGKSPGIDDLSPMPSLALMAFQQKSISTEEKQCSVSSRICLPTSWRNKLYHSTSGLQSLSRYKNEGEKSDCSNFHSLTLISIAGKLLSFFSDNNYAGYNFAWW